MDVMLLIILIVNLPLVFLGFVSLLSYLLPAAFPKHYRTGGAAGESDISFGDTDGGGDGGGGDGGGGGGGE